MVSRMQCSLPVVLGLILGSSTVHAATVAFWRFQEVPGTTVLDQSGKGNNGVILNGAGYTDGACYAGSQAILFSPSSPPQAAVIPDSPSLRPALGLTIEAWIKPSPGAWVLTGKQLGAGCCSNSFQIELRAGGPLNFILSDPGRGEHMCSSGVQPSTGVWHHVAATWDGATMLLYLDGVVVASAPYGGPIGYDSNPVLIGADDDGGGNPGCCGFLGAMDDVRISDVALSPPEFLFPCSLLGVEATSGGRLFSVWPNPAGVEATIAYTAAVGERAELSIYDVSGRLVRSLPDAPGGGARVARWDLSAQNGARVSAGTYFVRLRRASGEATRRLIVAR